MVAALNMDVSGSAGQRSQWLSKYVRTAPCDVVCAKVVGLCVSHGVCVRVSQRCKGTALCYFLSVYSDTDSVMPETKPNETRIHDIEIMRRGITCHVCRVLRRVSNVLRRVV